jgi:hypothetical protein
MTATLRILNLIVREMGGRIISSAGRSVGFKDADNQIRKLTVVDDDIILEQISGPERGKRAGIATLSAMLKAAAEKNAN